jgi:hypothetical protein
MFLFQPMLLLLTKNKLSIDQHVSVSSKLD